MKYYKGFRYQVDIPWRLSERVLDERALRG